MQIQRKINDWQLVQSVANQIPWLSAQVTDQTSDGDQEIPTQIELTFDGLGIASAGPSPETIACGNKHQLTINLPDDYPKSPPLVQFVSPLFHPNVSADGLVHLGDIGLSWQPEMTLDVVCERIWDVIRAAYVDKESVVNQSAGEWYLVEESRFPLDGRSLSKPKDSLANIVSYHRKGRPKKATRQTDVIVIDETAEQNHHVNVGTHGGNEIELQSESSQKSTDGIHFLS